MTNINSSAGRERRSYERFPFRDPVKLHFYDYETFELSAIDISAGGLAVRSSMNFPAGVLCRINVSIPITNGALNFESEAKIEHSIYSRYEAGFKLGISFTEIEPSLQTAIVCLMRGIGNKKDEALSQIARLGRH